MRTKDKFTLILLLIASTICMVVTADQTPKDKQAPQLRVIQVPPNYINLYAGAQQRTIDAFKVATNTPEWKNYVIMLNQQETVLTGIQGELSIKPLTDNCKPVFLRDGKRSLEDGSPVDANNGKLDHFECPPIKEQKP